MSIQIGSVSVASDETATGSGLALLLYERIKAIEEVYKPLPSLTPPPTWSQPAQAWVNQMTEARQRILQAWARTANEHAQACGARRITWVDSGSSYDVDPEDDIIVVSGADIGGHLTLNMPQASGSPGRELVVKCAVMSGWSINVTRYGSDTIDGAVSATVAGDWAKETFVGHAAGNEWLSV